MSLPEAPEARPFYQSAKQRFDDAEFLLMSLRTTGAVYLAGYGIECMLKALILEATPAGGRDEILASFRGARAHDYDWLKAKYQGQGGPSFPAAVARHFTLVNPWSTDLRYRAGAIKRNDAEAFLNAAKAIMEWADGRL
jgi:hypothetical protein